MPLLNPLAPILSSRPPCGTCGGAHASFGAEINCRRAERFVRRRAAFSFSNAIHPRPTMPTLDLDHINRATDLRRYAQSLGYQERPTDSLPGIALLEHPRLGDCVAIARLARADIYARVQSDELKRSPGDSDEQARARLRDAITRSADTGLASDFVHSTRRLMGYETVSPDRVAAHLHGWNLAQRSLAQHAGTSPPDPVPPPSLPSAEQRIRQWQRDAQVLAGRMTAAFTSSREAGLERATRGMAPDRRLRGDELAPDDRARLQDGLSARIDQARSLELGRAPHPALPPHRRGPDRSR